MATGHMKYGGSAMALTLICPGNVAAQIACPSKSSEAAERGTRIHAWLERYLKGDYSVKAKTDRDKTEAQIAAHAGDEIKKIIASHGMTLEDFQIENQMRFDGRPLELDPNGEPCRCCQYKGCGGGAECAGGTPDLNGHRPFYDMVTIDLKGGRKQVIAQDNDQLPFYGITAFNKLDPFTRQTLQNWHGYIVQPDAEPPHEVKVRSVTMPISELLNHESRFSEAIQHAEDNPDRRVAGTHCKDLYCDARTTCPAYLAYAAEGGNAETDALTAPVLATTTAAERLNALLNVDKKWGELIKQAKEDAKALELAAPGSLADWYLKTDVQGDREFTDLKKAEKALKEMGLKIDDIAPRKMLSVKGVEDLCKAKGLDFGALSELIIRPDAAPQLKKGQNPNPVPFAPPEESAPDPSGNSPATTPAQAGPSAPLTVEALIGASMPISTGAADPKALAPA